MRSGMWSRRIAVLIALTVVAGCERDGAPVAPLAHPPRLSATEGAGTWTTKAPMPTARWGLAAGVVNGILYAIGGGGTSGFSDPTVVEAYDLATNTWTTKAP